MHKFGVVGLHGGPVPGYRKFGVPVGGAFDQESLATVNILSGNSALSPAWELGMAQATFEVSQGGLVSIVGADSHFLYGGRQFESGIVFAVSPNETITIETPRVGARVYSAWGPARRTPGWRLRLEELPDSVKNRGVLRVIPGPQSDHFDLSVLDQPFIVSQTGNRMGVRLEGSIGEHRIELPSEPQCVGAIQVTNDGTLILIGPDGPTIGGYPKIGVVISGDVNRIGQLQPGDVTRFELCTVESGRNVGQTESRSRERKLQMLSLAVAGK